MMNTQVSTEQLEALATLMQRVPEALRDCIASKISGIIDGAVLAAAIEAQKLSA